MSEWISVDERLPAVHDWYIGYSEEGIDTYFFDADHKKWLDHAKSIEEANEVCGITHWKPLPPPPESVQ